MALRVVIVGTGLIGASLGLALRALGPSADLTVLGWDANPGELAAAHALGAFDEALPSREAVLTLSPVADIYVLATPVMPILDWMQQLAPVLPATSLITDVGSTKQAIVELATTLGAMPNAPGFLPGHPMAGKEHGGAAHAESTLFRDAAWLFTPLAGPPAPLGARWRALVQAIGASALDLDAREHDRICAWVSHLPQMLSTALAALLQETFAEDPQGQALVHAIGGRALRETTRLGGSPYSMWRDIAMTNTEPVAATLFALEQELAHLRESLREPGLREEFTKANHFQHEMNAREK